MSSDAGGPEGGDRSVWHLNSSSLSENVRLEQIPKGHGRVFQAYVTACGERVSDVFKEQQRSRCGRSRASEGRMRG